MEEQAPMHDGHPIVQGLVIKDEQGNDPMLNLQAAEVHDIVDPTVNIKNYQGWQEIDQSAVVGRDEEASAWLDPSQERIPGPRTVITPNRERREEREKRIYVPFDFENFHATSTRFATMSAGTRRRRARSTNGDGAMTVTDVVPASPEDIAEMDHSEALIVLWGILLALRSDLYKTTAPDHSKLRKDQFRQAA